MQSSLTGSLSSKSQVVQLAASGNFEDALALCKLLPPEDAALRASKEDAIHIRYFFWIVSTSLHV